jgi:hypothetical protein
MSMITHILPYELTLNILTMFTDIRDIISLTKSNDDINKIIIKNLNYVIKNLINNNKFSYPQMSILINSCYYKHRNYKNKIYNIKNKIYNIKNACVFISNVSKEIIIKELNDLNDKIKEEENHEYRIFDDEIIPLSKSHNEIYKMYYHCRINKNLEHGDAITASINLTWKDFLKLNFYLGIGYKPNDAIEAARFTDEDVIKMNMLIKNQIGVTNAIRSVIELSDEDITKMLSLVNRGISPDNAFDIVNEFSDNLIEIVFNLINEGIEYKFARDIVFYPKKYHNIILKLNRKKINMDMIMDIIENYGGRFSWFDIMIDNEIDKDFALEIIKDDDIYKHTFNKFIKLIKIKIECKMARTIVKKFESDMIIRFIALINRNIDVKIAFDVIDLFNYKQIIKFLILLKDGFDGKTAYDMVMLYDNNQRMMCSIFIKNGISSDLVESYTDEQIKTFIKMVNEDNVDFNTAKAFIESIEPPAKRIR